jgi:hypothetical protein
MKLCTHRSFSRGIFFKARLVKTRLLIVFNVEGAVEGLGGLHQRLERKNATAPEAERRSWIDTKELILVDHCKVDKSI